MRIEIQKWTDPAIKSIESGIENAIRHPRDSRANFNAWLQLIFKNDSRAMSFARASLDETPPTSPSRKFMLDVLVSTGLDYDLLRVEPNGRALLEESLALDRSGLGNLATYGAGLIDLNEDDAGRMILIDVTTRSESPINLAYAHTFLAIADKKAGNLSSARAHAAKAKKHFASCPCLKRIADLLEPEQRKP